MASAYTLQHTAELIDHKLGLIDKNKNLLPYPYTTNLTDGGFPIGLEDVGDGSILTTGTGPTDHSLRLNIFSLPTGTKYIVSLSVTNILEEIVTSTAGFYLQIAVDGEYKYQTTSELAYTTLDLTDMTVEDRAITVTLCIPESFEKGLLIKPQIELQPTNEDGTPSNEPTAWVPNMDKIGTYVDRRFNSTNAKIKALNERINNGLPDCTDSSDDSTLVVKDGAWTIKSAFSEGLDYELNEDSTYYVVKGIGTCEDTDLKFPTTYNGLPVKDIEYIAFENCAKLTSVDLPYWVVLGTGCFQNCANLTSVTSATDISSHAFEGCTSLTTIELKKNAQMTAIGDYAFYNCTSLTSVTIPDSVTGIYTEAFSGCSSLRNITIPASVTRIGDQAFSNCDNLTDIYYQGTKEEWDIIDLNSSDDWLTNKNIYFMSREIVMAGSDYYSPENYEVPEDYKKYPIIFWTLDVGGTFTVFGEKNTGIQDSDASRYHSGGWDAHKDQIETVIIRYGIIRIGSSRFSSCHNLTSVTIPGSVTYISNKAFSDCNSLIEINCAFAEGAVAGAPWGAKNVTINYTDDRVDY